MQKQKYTVTKGCYVGIALLLITYLIAPSWYRTISQKIFGILYRQHAQYLLGNSEHADIVNTSPSEAVLPIFVIARPPQTPYDYLITTATKGNWRQKQEDEMQYVYNNKMEPMGYIEKMYQSVFTVTLFSSPKSEEQFSVNGYVSSGRGQGGGSFFLEVPLDVNITVGMPILHQMTGKIASTVITIKTVPEKNIQKVAGIVGSSPLEMGVLYMEKEPRSNSTPEAIDAITEEIEAFSKEAETAAEIEKEAE